MRAVVQRISSGQVRVEDQVVGQAGQGLMVLVGFSKSDQASLDGQRYMVDKLLNLRIFEDQDQKMNLSVKDIDGDLLIVPNFTLYGDCRKGRRPGFSAGAPVDGAKGLFEDFLKTIKALHPKTASGIFQVDMAVSIVNDGPVTLILDSDKIL